ncbi:MAG TPA: hypothetical protein VGS41_07860, partial [Chthonomonadales bacterium]|nr:hypothetical protein [Chthonomonadales bacterium]
MHIQTSKRVTPDGAGRRRHPVARIALALGAAAAVAIPCAAGGQRPAPPAHAVSAPLVFDEAHAPVELNSQRADVTVTHGSCLIRGGTLLTVSHGVITNGSVLIQNGKIVAVGRGIADVPGVPVIDARGEFITPGLVDAHSHIAADEVNEGADSITAEVRVRDVLQPKSLSIYRGLSSGVTSTVILHGSANPIGGQCVVVKMKYNRPVDELPIPDAPRMIKFALGENVTRSNDSFSRGGPRRYPTTRMGVEAVYRRAFDAARKYTGEWDNYRA